MDWLIFFISIFIMCTVYHCTDYMFFIDSDDRLTDKNNSTESELNTQSNKNNAQIPTAPQINYNNSTQVSNNRTQATNSSTQQNEFPPKINPYQGQGPHFSTPNPEYRTTTAQDYANNNKAQVKPQIPIEHILDQINQLITSSTDETVFKNSILMKLQDYKISINKSQLYTIIVNDKMYGFFNPFDSLPAIFTNSTYYQPLPTSHHKVKRFKKLAILNQQQLPLYSGELELEVIKKLVSSHDVRQRVNQIILDYMNETINKQYSKDIFDLEIKNKVESCLRSNDIKDIVELVNYSNDLKSLKIDAIEYVIFYPNARNIGLQNYYNQAQNQSWTIKELKAICTIVNGHPQNRGFIEYNDPASSTVFRDIIQITQRSIKDAALEIARLSFKEQWTEQEISIWNNNYSSYFKITIFKDYILFDSNSEKKIYISPLPKTTTKQISGKILKPAHASNNFDIIDIVDLAIVDKTNIPAISTGYNISELVEATSHIGSYKNA